MKLTMLGTGKAVVTECYNTCFVLSDGKKHFLVDGGGGSGILKQLKSAGIDWKEIRDIFVTHRHMDHILGVMWLIRMIAQAMKQDEYEERQGYTVIRRCSVSLTICLICSWRRERLSLWADGSSWFRYPMEMCLTLSVTKLRFLIFILQKRNSMDLLCI